MEYIVNHVARQQSRLLQRSSQRPGVRGATKCVLNRPCSNKRAQFAALGNHAEFAVLIVICVERVTDKHNI